MAVARIPSVEGGIQPTLLDVKGDLITATANDTPARLGVGANNSMLTADSTASTGLKYSMPASLATNARTASYTLVAADAGTRVTMNSASATTVTVNTGLFAANDVVQITNLGAGVLTITAGTATVSTAGVLTLAQNASGSLYFTSTGVSIWDGSAAAASGGMTSLATGSMTGTANLTLSSISGAYQDLVLILKGFAVATNSDLAWTINGITTGYSAISTAISGDAANSYWTTGATKGTGTGSNIKLIFPNYAIAGLLKVTNIYGTYDSNTAGQYTRYNLMGMATTTAAITSITISSNVGNWTSGTYELLGVK